ncbi:MAG: hypothetical protein II117_00395 [Clostridia bacterium]|nr:hypothetical protein [Clostridia bacterium]
MHLTRKQTILIVTISGVAALLIVGLILLINYGNKRDPIPQEPQLPPASDTPAPTGTPAPTMTPEPTATPSPTPYFLPLVPEGTVKTPTPHPASPTPSPTPTASPEAAAPRIHPNPRDGTYNDHSKDFMAIGTQNGEAIAVLLVHVEPPNTTVVAIPPETLAMVYTLGSNTSITGVETAQLGTATARAESEREGCWNLIWAVKNLVGFRAPAYLCVDFGCMESFFSFVPSLDGIDYAAFSGMLQETGEVRARSMAKLGVGIVRYLGKVSLWELPSFRSATRGAFSSNLSVFELLGLMSDLKKAGEFSVSVLPTELIGGVRVLSEGAELPF